MTKDDIYRLIEYDGVYNAKVKKNLKNLIKKYHPDHKGDEKVLKVIFEVKKELENNTVSINKDNKKNKDIFNKKSFNTSEHLEYINEIIRLEEIRNNKKNTLKCLYNNLSTTYQDYSMVYDNYYNLKNILCECQDKLSQSNNKNFKFIILTIIAITLIFLYVAFKVQLLLLAAIFIFVYNIAFYTKCLKNEKYLYKKLDKCCDKLKTADDKASKTKESINNTMDEIIKLKREIVKIENDIRFYKNKIK